MEIYIAAVVFGIVLLFASTWIFGHIFSFILFYWPTFIGIGGGIWIWIEINGFLGSVFALLCFYGQYAWNKKSAFIEFFPRHPMAGKRGFYDKNGRLRGFIDKD